MNEEIWKLNMVDKFLKSQKVTNYIYTGGFDNAERKILLIYPHKIEQFVDKLNLNDYISAIRINLAEELEGEYSHRNYLGAIMKLGIKRPKVGDILVDRNGADILITKDVEKFLMSNLAELTRFSKSSIQKIQLEDLRKLQVIKEEVNIIIPSMRLDNIVSELANLSRNKANELLLAQRVLVNHEIIQKSSKEIKQGDVITIRGKGRFTIKSIIGNTKKGRILLSVEKFANI